MLKVQAVRFSDGRDGVYKRQARYLNLTTGKVSVIKLDGEDHG